MTTENDMQEVTQEMVEAAARATCALDRADPDEIMPDGLPRWRDREEHSRVAIQAALATARAEREALEAKVARLLECHDGRRGDMGWNLALLTERANAIRATLTERPND